MTITTAAFSYYAYKIKPFIWHKDAAAKIYLKGKYISTARVYCSQDHGRFLVDIDTPTLGTGNYINEKTHYVGRVDWLGVRLKEPSFILLERDPPPCDTMPYLAIDLPDPHLHIYSNSLSYESTLGHVDVYHLSL